MAIKAIITEDFDTYKRKSEQYMTSSALSDFIQCPLLYKQRRDGIIPEKESMAFAFGNAVHMAVLEGRGKLDATYAVGGPINPRTGKSYGTETQAFAEWMAGHGKPAITQEQYDDIVNMEDSVRSHGEAKTLLSNGVAEGVLRATYDGVDCQIRPDWYNPDSGIIEFKSTDDLDFFIYDARKYRYHHRLAFYSLILSTVTGKAGDITIIATEKRAPFRTGVWRYDTAYIDALVDDVKTAITEYKKCNSDDIWPTRYEAIRYITA